MFISSTVPVSKSPQPCGSLYQIFQSQSLEEEHKALFSNVHFLRTLLPQALVGYSMGVTKCFLSTLIHFQLHGPQE